LPTPGWRLEDVDGVRLARCEALEAISGIAHAFSTRCAAGRTDFDLGPGEGEDEAVLRRRETFLRAAGLGEARPLILRQVHGNRIVDAGNQATRPPEADGSLRLGTTTPDLPLPAVRTADCVALLLVDRETRSVAAVHAGWRGTAQSIAVAAVAALQSRGAVPGNLVAAMGPAILACCYEVGDEVAAAVVAACPPGRLSAGRGRHGKATIDLHAANRAQLLAAGLRDADIHAAPWCTRCRNDLFFSVRAEGTSAGRLMAVVGPSVSA
jgi:polyphenol oxidase